MNISPEEAQQALASVQQTKDRTNQTLSRVAIYEVLWGTISFIGFLISYFFPTNPGFVLNWTWGILGVLGGVLIGHGLYWLRPRRR
jgi:hypothetical protein